MSDINIKTENTPADTEALIRREYRRRALGLDKMCDWDFAHDNGENPELTEIGKNYVLHYEELKEQGMGLMYFGGTGAGKSYAAAQIVNALTDAGFNCLFTSFRSILTDLCTLSNEAKQNYLKNLFRLDLIVFDEYGSEGETNFNNQMVLHIISTCYQKYIPMIVTTAYHRESLVKSNNHMRLMALSRLWQRCCCIQVAVPHSRRYQTRENLNKEEYLLKGPGPHYEEPADFTEPCQEEKEAARRKEEMEKALRKEEKKALQRKNAKKQEQNKKTEQPKLLE